MEKRSVLKIFVDAHVFDGLPQGTRTFIKGIYTQMARYPGIRLYLGAHDIQQLALVFPPSGNVVLVKYRSTSSVRRLLFEIPSIIRRYEIDYAHFQYITPVWKNCRLIVTIHDVIFKDFPDEFSRFYRLQKRLLYGLGAHRADILTTVSEYSKTSIRKFLHTGHRPIHVIPNAIGGQYLEPYDERASRAYIRDKYGLGDFILYVSRIEPRKNHLLLLKAWLELKAYEKGIYLAFLGHETLPVPEFDRFIDRLPDDAKNFLFVRDDINDGDLLEMYRACRVFAYPSKAEGFGIPPLEAGALKKPVLCSNSSAMKEFSFFGPNLIDPYDYDAFRERLREVLVAPPDDVFLEHVAACIRKEYSWENSASRLYRLLAPDQKYSTLAPS